MKPLALVVENDVGTRRLLSVVLGRAGFEVDVVASGHDGRLLLQHVEYDAILLDLLLPGRSGNDLLATLAEVRPDALARTAVLSAASDIQLNAVRQKWLVRVIRKPFDLTEIAETAQAVAAGRAPRARMAAEEFCRRSIVAGAKSGVVVRSNGEAVVPVMSFGYPTNMVERFFPMTISQPYPICDALREGRPLWVDAPQDRYPTLATIFQQNQSAALAAVPLQWNKTVVGAVGWTFREPRRFASEEQAAFSMIAAELSERVARDGQSDRLRGS